MEPGKALKLARTLTELDVKRDRLLEELLRTAGKDAYELLRLVQNGELRQMKRQSP
ncbi:hypothetical protein [Bacillus sp. FJAT-42376]|uniref:hypothetical protein n=1 Tax=Bacillus sp. FJAT-42376 TaxID=2014076 RepID=UPI001F155687|nr:hypothetical protein [Bacillus sp. FJAT-42376]